MDHKLSVLGEHFCGWKKVNIFSVVISFCKENKRTNEEQLFEKIHDTILWPNGTENRFSWLCWVLLSLLSLESGSNWCYPEYPVVAFCSARNFGHKLYLSNNNFTLSEKLIVLPKIQIKVIRKSIFNYILFSPTKCGNTFKDICCLFVFRHKVWMKKFFKK